MGSGLLSSVRATPHHECLGLTQGSSWLDTLLDELPILGDLPVRRGVQTLSHLLIGRHLSAGASDSVLRYDLINAEIGHLLS